VVCCGIELAPFCVEDDGDIFNGVAFFFDNKRACVFCDDVQGAYRDDFCVICEVDDFCQGDGDSQSCKAAWACGDINMSDLGRLLAKLVENLANRRENFGTVPHYAGKSNLAEDFWAFCDRDRAYSSGGFDSENKWILARFVNLGNFGIQDCAALSPHYE